jgi:hypothetical protein
MLITGLNTKIIESYVQSERLFYQSVYRTTEFEKIQKNLHHLQRKNTNYSFTPYYTGDRTVSNPKYSNDLRRKA